MPTLNNIFLNYMDGMMLNDWLTPRQEKIVWITIELYHQVWLTNIISSKKVEGNITGEEATRIKGEINFDLISKRMFS